MKIVRIKKYGRYRDYVEIVCDTCGIIFLKRKSFYLKSVTNFCSIKCRDNYNFKIYKTDTDKTKICRLCKKEKSVDEFYKRSASKDGLTSKCKVCSKNNVKDFYTKNKKRKEFIVKRQEDNRTYHYKKKYGLSQVDYENLLLEQNGVCAICGNEETRIYRGKIAPLSVDHCHETGKVRGLLCNYCNVGLGNFKDDISSLLKAIEYLEKFK